VSKITVNAVDQASALGFHQALARFYSEIEQADDGRWLVSVPRESQTIVAILDTIEEHVTARGDGPALVDLDGHEYRIDSNPTIRLTDYDH
jgi:hypothetical protein